VSNFSKYRITGAGSEQYLQGLFTNTLPKVGRIGLTAMLNEHAHVIGEFSVARLDADDFLLFSSLGATEHHRRWFLKHLPAGSPVRVEVLGQTLVGLSLAGPRARDVLQATTRFDCSNDNFRFMDVRRFDVGMATCTVNRMTYSGDLGYEIWMRPEDQRHVFDTLMAAGEPHGLRLFGVRALLSLRLEKMFGTWFREYRPIFNPYECRMDRFIKLDHDFVGRAALEAAPPPRKYLSYFEVDIDPADAADVIGDEPIWHGDSVVGWITSGGYAHYTQKSLALGYVDAEVIDGLANDPGDTPFVIEIIGRRRPATLLREPVLDPAGERMRS
jgi:dimethylglycine dehydrogenase